MSDCEFFTCVPHQRRDAPRRDVSLAACVISHGLLFPCRVTDCTDAGARLEFSRAIFISGDVTLCIDEHEIDADCTIVWRKGTSMGIRFKDRLIIPDDLALQQSA